jgi:hypothetical protein
MGFIKTILSLIILALIVIFGYWGYATFTTKAPNDDQIWVTINTYMPDPLKAWSCGKIKDNNPGLTGITSCQG